MTCAVPNCDRPAKAARRMCHTHYGRWLTSKYIDVDIDRPIHTPLVHTPDHCGTCGAGPTGYVVRLVCAPWCWTQRFAGGLGTDGGEARRAEAARDGEAA